MHDSSRNQQLLTGLRMMYLPLDLKLHPAFPDNHVVAFRLGVLDDMSLMREGEF